MALILTRQVDHSSIEEYNEESANRVLLLSASSSSAGAAEGGGAAPGCSSSSSCSSSQAPPITASDEASHLSSASHAAAPAAPPTWHVSLPEVGFPPTADEEILKSIPDPYHFGQDHRTPSLSPSFLAHLSNTNKVRHDMALSHHHHYVACLARSCTQTGRPYQVRVLLV